MAKSGENQHRRDFKVYFLMTIGVGFLVWRDPSPGLGWWLFNSCVFYFANLPATILHEIGHVLGGILTRWRAFQVVIGWYGKPVFEKRLWGVKWQLNSVPVGGFAYIFPVNEKWFRTKASVVYLAGPMANAIAAVICFSFVSLPFPAASEGLAVTGMFGLANLICVVMSVIPWKIKTVTGSMDNDGRLVCQTFFNRREFRNKVMAGSYQMESITLREREEYLAAAQLVDHALLQYSDNFELLSMKHLLALDLGHYQDARLGYQEMLGKNCKTPFHEALILNNIAWADIMIGDEQLLPEALHNSEKAMTVLGTESAIQGTRGSALILTGNVTEGIALLKQAIASKGADTRGEALNACMIGIGESKLGNMAECNRWREIAEQLDAKCPLLGRIPNENGEVAVGRGWYGD